MRAWYPTNLWRHIVDNNRCRTLGEFSYTYRMEMTVNVCISIYVFIYYIYCNNTDDRWSDIVDKGRIKAHRKRTRSYIDHVRAASCATILIAFNVRTFNITQTNSHGYWYRTGRWLYLQTDRIATHTLGLHPVVSNSLKIYTNAFYFFFRFPLQQLFSTYRWDVFTRVLYVCVCVTLYSGSSGRSPAMRPATRFPAAVCPSENAYNG